MISKEKLSIIINTYKTSKRLLGIVWQVDKKLFIALSVAAIIPAIVPFVNGYIYKLVIDMVVAGVNTSIFDISKLYPLLFFRILTSFIQDAAFSTQSYIETI